MRDGNVYSGDFVSGMFEGKVVLTFASEGKKFIGEFHNNEIEGDGKMIFEDGSILEGHFVKGQLQGVGSKHFKNGDRYEGNFVDS